MRLMVKSTARSVIWADADICLIGETIAQSVIEADTDLRLTVKTTTQSVILADTDITLCRPVMQILFPAWCHVWYSI